MSKGLTARLVLGIVLGLSPIAGYSLGLGKLKVLSGLNEPLRAEIEFTSIADNERRGLNATIAPRADFAAAGAERLPFLSQIKFQVVQRADGRYFLELTSDQPMEEPFLHMLLQLEWAGGRMVREYTALIDPPSYMVSKPAMIEAPSTASSAPIATPAPAPSDLVQTVPPPTSDPIPAPQAHTAPQVAATPASVPEKPAEPMLKQEPVTVAAPEPAAGSESVLPIPPSYTVPTDFTQRQPEQPAQQPAAVMSGGAPVEYRVQSGDTLWSIAQRLREDKQMTMEQVIVAIFKNNRDAFYRENVNNLRAGKVLKIPERDTIAQTVAIEARREFKMQYDAWQEYKLKLAAGSRTMKVSDSAAAPADAEPTTAAPIKTPAGQAAKPAVTPATEMLKIVRNPDAKPNPGAGKGTEAPKDAEKGERAALADRASTLEESLESKQLENRELSEKIGQVRAQIKNEKRLMELENQALAKQTQPKGETPKPDARPIPKAPEVVKPESAVPVEPSKPVKPVENVKPPETAAVKPVPKPVAPAVRKEDDSFATLLATLLNDISVGSALPLVGGILALGGGVILIIYLRRRRRSIAEFEESILASDAIASESPPAPGESNTTGQAVTTGDTSFLSDFSKAGMGHMQTDEVDPIAEAEVYLAYGRDETAEEILKEAIVKNPDRQELKHKLLEIYHQRNDTNAFETLAEELYASLGGRGGKMWEKVEEMGRKLNPENPMFRGGAPAPAGRRTTDKAAAVGAPAMAPTMMADLGASSANAPTQLVDAGGIDFDGATSVADAAAEPVLDFDFKETKSAAKPEAVKAEDLGSIDFGELATPDTGADNLINFESAKSEAAVGLADAPAVATDDEIKWELDASVLEAGVSESAPPDASGQEAHWDETATKLDLAKAYIDMGDADGARSILDEVLAEGNDQQKRQAADLASQIA